MSELDQIRNVLQSVRRRHRLLQGWTGLWFGASIGAGLYAAALSVYKVAPVPDSLPRLAAWICLAFLPAGFLAFWSRPFTEFQAARRIDDHFKLRELLGTALQLSQKTSAAASDWIALITRDAAAAAQSVKPAEALPWFLPRAFRWFAGFAALAFILQFVPAYRSPERIQAKKDAANIKETGRSLALLTRRSLDTRKPTLENTRQTLEKVAELGDRLQKTSLTRSDALKDLANVKDQVKDQLSQLAKNPTLRRLEQAARKSNGASKQSAESLQRQMDALKKELGATPENAADKLADLKRDLQKLKDAGRAMADQGPAAAESAKSDLAQSASELARKAEAMGISLPGLEQAIAALNSAKAEQFLRDLNIAEKNLDKLAENARALAEMQQQAEKLGKNLAEQLQNGQAQAAAESLEKMEQKLANASEQEREDMIRELEESLKPAENYGEVLQHLKEAAASAKKKDAGGAAKSLAEAREALEKQMEEHADAENLLAALGNLDKAQLAIGNGDQGRWAAKASTGPPRAGKGSKGGRGVGTWAEDNPWAMPDGIDEAWDNTGLNRPDMAAKGHTDRDSSVSPNVLPTKVQGQIQPGGPMPSISLKGVSIKGSSQVQYTEAVQSAQSDAQSALNQDRIPRAYRNAVRDYFDELK